jgi:hypothetical protein
MESVSSSIAPQTSAPAESRDRAGMDPPPEAPWGLLSEMTRAADRRPSAGAHIGVLSGVGPVGEPLVECESVAPGRSLPARSTVPVTERDIGREVVLLFEQADVGKPIIMGLLQPTPAPAKAGTVAVERNGERLTLTADREIVLRCGKASLTLTRAGKVLIRGAYLLSRSSGVNRIKGGSVQIN